MCCDGPVVFHNTLCCSGSLNDYGDVYAHQVPTDLAVNCKFGLVSTCHRPMIAAMTSESCGLNYETKDLLKLDSFVIWTSAKSSSHRTNDAFERENQSQKHEKGNREMSAVDSQHHRHDWNAKYSVAVACFTLIETFPGGIGFRRFLSTTKGDWSEISAAMTILCRWWRSGGGKLMWFTRAARNRRKIRSVTN